MKEGPWIENFGFSNLLYIRATHTITNHALIGEYQLCFFLREEFICSCGLYLIKTRYYILLTVQDLIKVEIQIEKLYFSSFHSSNTIHMLSPLEKTLHNQTILLQLYHLIYKFFLVFSFRLFSFYFFSILFSFSFILFPFYFLSLLFLLSFILFCFLSNIVTKQLPWFATALYIINC